MILVVDDEEDILELFGYTLELLGYRASLAETVDQALTVYRQSQSQGAGIAAVITDLSFPGGQGGRDLAEALRCLDPFVQVIVCSGDTAAPEMLEPARFGFAAALEKRFDRSHIAQVLASVVRPV